MISVTGRKQYSVHVRSLWAGHVLSESSLRLSLTEVLKDSSQELLDHKDEILSGQGPLESCIIFDSLTARIYSVTIMAYFMLILLKKILPLIKTEKKGMFNGKHMR